MWFALTNLLAARNTKSQNDPCRQTRSVFSPEIRGEFNPLGRRQVTNPLAIQANGSSAKVALYAERLKVDLPHGPSSGPMGRQDTSDETSSTKWNLALCTWLAMTSCSQLILRPPRLGLGIKVRSQGGFIYQVFKFHFADAQPANPQFAQASAASQPRSQKTTTNQQGKPRSRKGKS